MLFVFFQDTEVDNNIIQKGTSKVIKIFLQNIIHQTLKDYKHIGETKEHY